MSTVITAGRLLLVVVFVLAAAGKLLDRPGSRSALIDFDVPPSVAGIVALVLPALELAIALALLFQPTAAIGAVMAALLFAVFTGGIGRVLLSGRAPDCHCFGQLHSSPAGRRTLIRNGALFALAVSVSFAAPGKAIDSMFASRAGGASALAAAIVFLVLSAWLWARLRAQAGAPGSAQPLPVGAPAPMFEFPAATGELVTLPDLLGDRPVMLLFTSALCTQCRMFMPELSRWQARLAHVLCIVPVAYGDRHASQAHALEHGVEGMLFTDDDRGLIDAYAIPVTPCAILISPTGAIASAPIGGAEAIDALLGVMAHGRASELSVPSAATA